MFFFSKLLDRLGLSLVVEEITNLSAASSGRASYEIAAESSRTRGLCPQNTRTGSASRRLQNPFSFSILLKFSKIHYFSKSVLEKQPLSCISFFTP